MIVRIFIYKSDFISATVTNAPACGIQVIEPVPSLERINGGTEAVPHSWPWVRKNSLDIYT